ncbi:MAG: hypothetical protein ACRD2U_12485 [Terriglobales bacterium]
MSIATDYKSCLIAWAKHGGGGVAKVALGAWWKSGHRLVERQSPSGRTAIYGRFLNPD